MVKELYFFNWAGKGDIHLSRGFCKHLLKELQPQKSVYYHRFSSDSFTDICPNAPISEITPLVTSQYPSSPQHCPFFSDPQSSFYLNTWIGSVIGVGRYGEGCSHETTQLAYKNFLKHISHVPRDPQALFVPQIGYEKCGVHLFDEGFLPQSKIKVLIDNCEPLSGQSESVDFSLVIPKLSSQFKNVNFFVLNKDPSIAPAKNIFFLEDISGPHANLNHFSYLSLFCDIIVGRTSGPYVHTLVTENVSNPHKTYICFCKNKIEASWIAPKDGQCQFIWNNYSDTHKIITTIANEINKKLS